MGNSTSSETESGSKNLSVPIYHPDMDLKQPSFCKTELTNELKEKVDVLLVTVTAIEWSAVFRKMKPFAGASQIFKVHHDKASYTVGMFGVYCVALVQSDDGPQGAHSVVKAALNCWNTKATILVGSCLGLKQDHNVGDVLVSQKLATYDRQRVVHSTQSNSLGLVIEGGQDLSPLFTKEAETHNWSFGNSTRQNGLLLSGSAIVESTEFADKLKFRYPEAVGLEAEGDGIYIACRDVSQQWIVIKGICGFLGSNKVTDAQAMKFAAAAATSLVLHVLSEESLQSIGCISIRDGNKRSDSWTPKPAKRFPLFNSYDSGLYRKHTRVANGLLPPCTEAKNLRSDTGSLAPSADDGTIKDTKTSTSYAAFVCHHIKDSGYATSVLKLTFKANHPEVKELYLPHFAYSLDDFLPQVRKSPVFLVLLSKGFFSSKWCIAELIEAFEHKKPFVAVRVIDRKEATFEPDEFATLCDTCPVLSDVDGQEFLRLKGLLQNGVYALRELSKTLLIDFDLSHLRTSEVLLNAQVAQIKQRLYKQAKPPGCIHR